MEGGGRGSEEGKEGGGREEGRGAVILYFIHSESGIVLLLLRQRLSLVSLRWKEKL